MRVWRQSNKILNILGKYEGNFFRYSMELMRKRYNSATQKVAFIVTSDNYGWTKNKLGNVSDTYFSRNFVQAPVKGNIDSVFLKKVYLDFFVLGERERGERDVYFDSDGVCTNSKY